MAQVSQGVNEAYIEQLLEDYLDAPASVPREWQELFAAQAPTVAPPGVDGDGDGQWRRCHRPLPSRRRPSLPARSRRRRPPGSRAAGAGAA